MGYLTNFIVYTLAMAGIMLLALFIFKSSTNIKGKNGAKYLRVLDTMTIAPRKTLYIVSAGEEKFLIAGDVDKTTLISKLDTKNTMQEKISAVATVENDDFSTRSFNLASETVNNKKYTDTNILGIKRSLTNKSFVQNNSYDSVMKNLAKRMNASINGGDK